MVLSWAVDMLQISAALEQEVLEHMPLGRSHQLICSRVGLKLCNCTIYVYVLLFHFPHNAFT